MLFTDLKLSQPVLAALDTAGYTTPTPIQSQAIPLVLKRKDLLACAQTGTGKTAAFSLPIIELLLQKKGDAKRDQPAVLILCPTRELAIQITENIAVYTAKTTLKYSVVFGGVSINNQIADLRKRPDIIIATPGRLLDLVNQGQLSLKKIEFLVLDEADRMLDMGFVHDIKKIINLLPTHRQNLLFSATIPDSIKALSHSILKDPEYVAVTPVSSTVDTIQQAIYPVQKGDKLGLLEQLIREETEKSLLVFSRTKHGADKIVRKLRKSGISADAIHGNKSQPARQQALKGFKSGKIQVLIATDIAARGIDIDALGLVINFDLPNEPETYVHRIGRTGRAGSSGRAWSFCSSDEIEYLWDIEKLIGFQIEKHTDHDFVPKDLSEYENNRAQKSTRPAQQAKGGNRQGASSRSSKRHHTARQGRHEGEATKAQHKGRRSGSSSKSGFKSAPKRGQ